MSFINQLFILVIATISFTQIISKERIVILIPFDPHDTTDQIFSGGPGNFWYQLKQECARCGFTLTTKCNHRSKDVYAIIAFNHHNQDALHIYKNAKKILYTWEPLTHSRANFSPQIHKLYDVVMTWDDRLVNNKKFRKFNYALQFNTPQTIIPFKEKKLCTMFAGNKSASHPQELYSKRIELINFFEQHAPDDFDLYGPDWPQSLITRGFVVDKFSYMRHYKFVFAYENMRDIPGYITEKIFDAFSAGCVPVYWGAPNIARYIPTNCFIAREQFENDQQLYEFLKNMSEADYNQYLENIRIFLLSQQAQQFSCKQFIKTFIDALNYS
ncbi:MAG: glycosyltransferase family 10 [Candidatus Dependentiae bacterium]|nr:glycosyltransferase family 10 [Candidatus Dependentiae bacterium]